MSTKLHDLANNALLGASQYPASLGSGTNNGSSVDMISADGRCFAIQMAGAVGGTDPTLSGKIQESDTGSSGWSDISGATFTEVAAASNVQCITFDRAKRYLRYVGVVGGSSTPTVLTSVVIGEQKKQL